MLQPPEEAGRAKIESDLTVEGPADDDNPPDAAAADDAPPDDAADDAAAADADAPPAKRRCARSVPTVSIGGVFVPCVGLGTLALGVCYPAERPARYVSLAIFRKAYANGIRFFDAADVYCRDQDDLHYAEKLLGDALRGLPEIVVSTKGGCRRRGDGSASTSWDFGYVLQPADVASTIAESAAAVGDGFTLMWSLHNTDAYDATGEDFQNVLRAMRVSAEKGVVQLLGLSNATCAHVRGAGLLGCP